jgi:hypothetical protein
MGILARGSDIDAAARKDVDVAAGLSQDPLVLRLVLPQIEAYRYAGASCREPVNLR